MASVVKRKAGGFLLQFYLKRERKTISFGSKYTLSEVQEIAQKVEHLVIALETDNPVSKKLDEWLKTSTREIINKLVNAGLIEIEEDLTARKLFDSYLSSFQFLKLTETSQRHKENTIKRFFAFFPVNTPAIVSPKDAQRFGDKLDSVYAEATRATTIRDLRTIYNFAIKQGIVDKNPFTEVRRGSYKNKKREFFVTREIYNGLLDACETQEQRVLFALYRIGGLRRSEAILLRWEDVDFEKRRVRVPSPKTEKVGKGERVIPLFPELRVELEQLEQGDGFVIQKCRNVLDYTVSKIIKKLCPKWARPIQNLRSSRAIEIFQQFGPIAEQEWIGHTERTAFDHYLHLLESDFERATM